MGNAAPKLTESPASRQNEVEKHSPLMMFDILRAMAAVLVLISHVRSLGIRDYASEAGIILKVFYAVTGLGHISVVVFFVISGYWIAGGVIKRVGRNLWSWSGYALDRLSRLWIVLVPALFIGLVFDCTGVYLLSLPVYTDGLHGNSVLSDIPAHLGIGTFLQNLIFVQTLLGPRLGSNGPLWSLANEFWYYFWFAAIYLPFRNPNLLRNWIAVPVALFTMYQFSILLQGFTIWLMGAALYFICSKLKRRSTLSRRLVWLGFLAAFVLALLGVRTLCSVSDWGDYIVAAAAACFLCATLWANIRPAAWLVPAARFGAHSSYSLYVLHYPIVIFAVGLLCRSERLAPSTSSLMLMSGIMAGAVVLSYFFSQVTEWKTTDLRGWVERKLSVFGIALR